MDVILVINYQFEECIYVKTRLVELLDKSTVPVVQKYERQPSAITTNLEAVSFLKRKKHISPEFLFTKHVVISV